MKKYYFLLFSSVLLANYSFSQTSHRKDKTSLGGMVPQQTQTSASQSSVISSAAGEQVFEKTPLPSNQKVNPAVFFLVNDKPVGQLQYQNHLRERRQKK